MTYADVPISMVLRQSDVIAEVHGFDNEHTKAMSWDNENDSPHHSQHTLLLGRPHHLCNPLLQQLQR